MDNFVLIDDEKEVEFEEPTAGSSGFHSISGDTHVPLSQAPVFSFCVKGELAKPVEPVMEAEGTYMTPLRGESKQLFTPTPSEVWMAQNRI